jgi:hypothetical protein
MNYIKGVAAGSHIFMGIVITVTFILMMLPVSAEESIPAYCYRDNRSIGNVSVYEDLNAAQMCNSLYYDCKGRCIACYHDFDYDDYVCVDISGRTFLR